MPERAGASDRVRRILRRVTGNDGAVTPRPGEPRIATGLDAVARIERAAGASVVGSAPDPAGRRSGGLSGREALGRALGLALGGRRASALVSGDDLGRCHDLLARAVRLRVPLTVHAAGGAAPAAASSGAVHLVATTVQEAADFAVVARHVAESGLCPVVVSIDGAETAFSIQDFREPPADLVAAFLGDAAEQLHPRTPAQEILFGDHRPRIPRWYDPERPLLAGAALEGPPAAAAELAGERFFDAHLPALLEESLAAWGELTGRRHRRVSLHRPRGAKLFLVAAGAMVGVAEAVADHLRRADGRGGPKVGVLGLRALRPFPAAAVVEALSGAGRSSRLVVLERSGAPAGAEPPLAAEVRGLLGRALENDQAERPVHAGIPALPASRVPSVAAVTWGAGGAPLRARDLADLCRSLDGAWRSRVVLGVGPAEDDPPSPKRQAFLDELDRAYPAPEPASHRAAGSPVEPPDGVFTIGLVQDHPGCHELLGELAALLHDVGDPERASFRSRPGRLSFAAEPFPDLGDELPVDLAIFTGMKTPRAAGLRRFGAIRKGGALLLAVAPDVGRGGPAPGISSPGAGLHSIVSREDVAHWTLDLSNGESEHRNEALLGAVVELLRRDGRVEATDRQLLRSRRARLEASGTGDPEARLDAFQAGIARLAPGPEALRRGTDADGPSPEPSVPFVARGAGVDASPLGDLPRHWHQVASLVRDGRSDALVPDPHLATGTLPPLSAALQDPARDRRLLPVWDAAACTGCGACWSACPDGAVVPAVLGAGALLDRAMAIAKERGHSPDALRMVASRLADAADRTLEAGAPAAELFDRAFQAVLPKLPLPAERRAAVEEAWGPVREALASHDSLSVARTEPFGERRQLLVVALDPDACTGCGACIEVCEPDALAAGADGADAVAAARSLTELVRTLPPPDRDALDAAAQHPEAGPLPAALLSEEARSVAVGGGPAGDEPGAGARTAVRQVLGALAHHRAREIETVRGEIAALRERLAAAIHDGLARTLPEGDLDALARGLETLSRPDAELSELTARVEGAFESERVDAPRLRRLVDSARRLNDLDWRLGTGAGGRGTAPFGLVAAPGAANAWAGSFPANPFAVPVLVDATGDAPALAAGLARGLADETVRNTRALRLARAELERPAEAGRVEEELSGLAWSDLEPAERRACPPTVVLVPEEALSGSAASAGALLPGIFRLLGDDLPVIVLCLAEADLGVGVDLPGLPAEARRTARPLPVEPGLLALAEPGAFVLQSSIAFPDHLAGGLAALAGHDGPSFVRLHAPSPGRHGFAPHLATRRAEAAVLSRVVPLFRATPVRTSEGAPAGPAAVVLDGNPDPEELWHADWDPIRFARGEARFAARFRPAADGDAETPPEPGPELLAARDRVAARWRTLQGLALADRELIAAAVAEAEERTARSLAAEHERERAAFTAAYESRIAGIADETRRRMAFTVRDRLMTLAALGSSKTGDAPREEAGP